MWGGHQPPPTHTTNMLLLVYSLVLHCGGGVLFDSQKIWLQDLKNLGADWGIRVTDDHGFPEVTPPHEASWLRACDASGDTCLC